MRRTLLIAAALLIVAGPALAQTVVGSKHDLSSTGGASSGFRSNNIVQVCVFCHTPHQPDSPFIDTDPLWNHSLSAEADYGVYGSDTLNANPAPFGGGSGSVSSLCMSCHDGTVGLGNLYNDPNNGGTPSNSATLISGTPLMGTDLSNDHPVNFTYDAGLATEDGELKTPVSASWVDAANEVPLFNETVQCASCHEPHNPTYTPFLVATNVQSSLCLKCHNK